MVLALLPKTEGGKSQLEEGWCSGITYRSTSLSRESPWHYISFLLFSPLSLSSLGVLGTPSAQWGKWREIWKGNQAFGEGNWHCILYYLKHIFFLASLCSYKDTGKDSWTGRKYGWKRIQQQNTAESYSLSLCALIWLKTKHHQHPLEVSREGGKWLPICLSMQCPGWF